MTPPTTNEDDGDNAKAKQESLQLPGAASLDSHAAALRRPSKDAGKQSKSDNSSSKDASPKAAKKPAPIHRSEKIKSENNENNNNNNNDAGGTAVAAPTETTTAAAKTESTTATAAAAAIATTLTTSKHKYDARWEANFELCKAYAREHGTFRVSKKTPAGKTLNAWVKRQRKIHRKGQLSKHRFRVLDEIGFEWDGNSPTAAGKPQAEHRWMDQYRKLLRYRDEHDGSTTISSSSTQSSSRWKELELWTRAQRAKYHRGNLPQEHQGLLESIGFVWNLYEDHWNDMYRRLKQYQEEHGTTCVPRTYQKDPKLGEWVKRQRRLCKRDDRVKLLDDIGFEWNRGRVSGRRLVNNRPNFRAAVIVPL